MSEKPKCAICGEPMPPGEEMFKFHGYSGDCQKPRLPPPTVTIVEWLESHKCRCYANDVERFSCGACRTLAELERLQMALYEAQAEVKRFRATEHKP